MTLGAKIGGSTRTHTLCGQAHLAPLPQRSRKKRKEIGDDKRLVPPLKSHHNTGRKQTNKEGGKRRTRAVTRKRCAGQSKSIFFFVSSDSVGVKHQQQLEHGGVGVEGKGRGRRHHQPRGGGDKKCRPSPETQTQNKRHVWVNETRRTRTAVCTFEAPK